MTLVVALAILVGLTAPTLAQETPPQILGGIIMSLAAMEECGIDSPELGAALSEAGERLRAHLNVPRGVAGKIAAEYAEEIAGADCSMARSIFDVTAPDLIAKAGQVR